MLIVMCILLLFQGIDLVNDNPENALLREVDKIRESQKTMTKTWENVNNQIAMNQNARHQLERDLANKDSAMHLDQTAHEVNISNICLIIMFKILKIVMC